MAKVLRPLAVVAAIAINVIPGAGQAISAGIFSALGVGGLAAAIGVGALAGALTAVVTVAGLASAATILRGKPSLAAGGISSRVQLAVNTPQWLLIGETAAPTQLIYFGTAGTDNKLLSQIYVHSCHEIDGFVGLSVNNTATSFPTPGGAYSGILAIQTATGSQTANPFTTVHGGLWGAAHIGRGLAMSHFRWTYDQAKLASGLPQNIQFTVRGIRVYDPRRDSTRGGSGTMRANDQTTWAYSVSGDAIGRNPALVHLSYRLGWRKNGKLWAGMGEDPANINFAEYIAAANVCDEIVGGDRRYRIDGALSLGEVHNINLGKIAATCAGKPTDNGGLLGLWAAADDTAVPVMTLNPGDWLGDIQWDPLPEGEVRNTARGQFVDPAQFYSPQPYAEVAPSDLRALDNGEELADTLDFALVQDFNQARRLASVRLRESRQGVLQAPAALKLLGVRPTQVIAVNHPRFAWTGERFRVETLGLSIDKVQLRLRRVQASDYADLSASSLAAVGNLPTSGYVPSLTDDGLVVGTSVPTTVASLISNAASSMLVPAAPTIRADFTGVALAGQLPRTAKATRTLGGTDVSSSTSWSIVATGCTATIDSSGLVTITAVATTGKIAVTSLRDGVTLTGEFAVSKELQAAPAAGGGGATTAFDTTIGSVSGTSYSGAQAGILTVRATSSGVVNLTAPLDFTVSSSTAAARGKWQWRPVGGSFSDVAAEIASALSAAVGEPGYIEVTQSQSGLTPGTDYEFQLQLRRLSGSGTVNFSGTATASAA